MEGGRAGITGALAALCVLAGAACGGGTGGNGTAERAQAPATTTTSADQAVDLGLTFRPVESAAPCDPTTITPATEVTDAAEVVLPDRPHESCYLLGPTVMRGAIATADARYDPAQRLWVVDVTFANDDFVAKVARPLVNQEVAIVLAGVVQSAPKVNPGTTGRSVQISGGYEEQEARDIAGALTVTN
jgi:preprotein translocase subunit SecD